MAGGLIELENEKNFKIDFELLKKFVHLVESSKIGRIKFACSEFEIEIESEKKSEHVCFSKDAAASFSDGEEFTKEAGVENETRGKVVSSPIVGTFYSSPAPGQPPFVQVGDKVKQGDIIYIVESMKLMNEVKS